MRVLKKGQPTQLVKWPRKCDCSWCHAVIEVEAKDCDFRPDLRKDGGDCYMTKCPECGDPIVLLPH